MPVVYIIPYTKRNRPHGSTYYYASTAFAYNVRRDFANNRRVGRSTVCACMNKEKEKTGLWMNTFQLELWVFGNFFKK